MCLCKVGSPSALSDCDLNQRLRQAAQEFGRTLYIPSGALWGGQDIQRLNDSGGLKVSAALMACGGGGFFFKKKNLIPAATISEMSSLLSSLPGIVHKDVQASILLPSDWRRAD